MPRKSTTISKFVDVLENFGVNVGVFRDQLIVEVAQRTVPRKAKKAKATKSLYAISEVSAVIATSSDPPTGTT